MAETPAELTELLHQLADGAWRSGEALAQLAGCSRAALAKRMQRLQKQFDLDVEAIAGRGYRLTQALDLLDADAIADAMSDHVRRSTVLMQTDSTNRWLLDAPAADDPQLCIAELQSAGRGRRGRAWQAPFASGIMLSVAVRFEQPATALGALPLAIGVCVAEALEECGVDQLQLKWPNDLRCSTGKLGGLLLEARGEMGGSFRVVVGLGLNVRHFPALNTLDQPACALDQLLHSPPSRTQLCIRLATAMLVTCRQFEQQGLAPFASRFEARDCLRDQPVVVHDRTPWQGVARGVDSAGALRVARADTGAITLVHAGDISVRSA